MKLFKDVEIVDHISNRYEMNRFINLGVSQNIGFPPPLMDFKRESFPVFPYRTSPDSEYQFFCIADEEISRVIQSVIDESVQWYTELSELLPKHHANKEELLRIKSYNLFQLVWWFMKRNSRNG